MNQQHYTVIIIVALVLFSIFRRVRRNMGWQQLNPGKMLFRIAIFFIIGLVFLVEGAVHPISLVSDAVGILIGVILAYYGAAMTRFDQRDGRWYYRPNTLIGSIVTAIFFWPPGLSPVRNVQSGKTRRITGKIPADRRFARYGQIRR